LTPSPLISLKNLPNTFILLFKQSKTELILVSKYPWMLLRSKSIVIVTFIVVAAPTLFEEVMHQSNYKKHIPVDIDMSDALQATTRHDKNNDYDWLSRHETYEL
jgi:hypothetical protein